jgi:pimeloyl-ACP methyl ester carboxylesterase
MHSFRNDGVDIAYLDEGEGDPVVLVHGFASTKEVNWLHPGWVSTLTRAGRRAIALDNRGHGASAKLYDPAAYHSAVMAEDVRALIDHLGIPRADVMGYSMGARIAAFLALAHPDRVRGVVLGGLGIRLVDGVGLPESIADALEASSLADVQDPQGRTFRAFAEQTKSDLRALAACIRGSRQTLSRQDCASSRCRCWSRSAARTMSRARRRTLRRCCRRGGRSTFRGATTCRRWATACSSRVCSTSWPSAADLKFLQQVLQIGEELQIEKRH